MNTTDSTRTRADRVQQLASFLADHPEVEADLADRTALAGRPVLSFHPRDASEVQTLIAALTEPGDTWNTASLTAGFVTLDTGALGYASVFLHLPAPERPTPPVSPEVAELFA